jgi:hypothetical protein
MTGDHQQPPAATVTTPTDREIHVERVFDAPGDRVFVVYTDPRSSPSGGARATGPPSSHPQPEHRGRSRGTVAAG